MTTAFCNAPTYDLGHPTYCGLELAHGGLHDDGAIQFRISLRKGKDRLQPVPPTAQLPEVVWAIRWTERTKDGVQRGWCGGGNGQGRLGDDEFGLFWTRKAARFGLRKLRIVARQLRSLTEVTYAIVRFTGKMPAGILEQARVPSAPAAAPSPETPPLPPVFHPGQITKSGGGESVQCALCPAYAVYDGELPTAAYVFQGLGWAITTVHGWLCPSCYAESWKTKDKAPGAPDDPIPHPSGIGELDTALTGYGAFPRKEAASAKPPVPTAASAPKPEALDPSFTRGDITKVPNGERVQCALCAQYRYHGGPLMVAAHDFWLVGWVNTSEHGWLCLGCHAESLKVKDKPPSAAPAAPSAEPPAPSPAAPEPPRAVRKPGAIRELVDDKDFRWSVVCGECTTSIRNSTPLLRDMVQALYDAAWTNSVAYGWICHECYIRTHIEPIQTRETKVAHADLERRTHERDETRASLRERTTERDQAQRECERLRAECATLRASLRTTERARAKAVEQGETYRGVIAKANKLSGYGSIGILQGVVRLQEDVQTLRTQLEARHADAAGGTHTGEVARLTERIADMKRVKYQEDLKHEALVRDLRAQLEARASAPERTEADVERAVRFERGLHVEAFEALQARYEVLAAQSRTQGKTIEGLEVACENLREAFGSRPYDVLAAKVERETWFMLRGVWQGRITRLSTDYDVLRGALKDARDAANQWRRDAEWFTRERADLRSALAGTEDEKRALLGRLEAARAAACEASGYPKEEILVAIHRLRGQLQNALSERNVQGVTLVAVEKELGSYVDRTGPEGWNAEVFLVDAIRQLKNEMGDYLELLHAAKKETDKLRTSHIAAFEELGTSNTALRTENGTLHDEVDHLKSVVREQQGYAREVQEARHVLRTELEEACRDRDAALANLHTENANVKSALINVEHFKAERDGFRAISEKVHADYIDLRARVDGVLRSVRAGAPAAGAPTSGAPAAAPAAAKGETK